MNEQRCHVCKAIQCVMKASQFHVFINVILIFKPQGSSMCLSLAHLRLYINWVIYQLFKLDTHNSVIHAAFPNLIGLTCFYGNKQFNVFYSGSFSCLRAKPNHRVMRLLICSCVLNLLIILHVCKHMSSEG